MTGELYGGPYDGMRLDLLLGDEEPPDALVFAAARALAGWQVTTISETTYRLADADELRYVHEP